MAGLHSRLTATPGGGKCSHGREAHATLLGREVGSRAFRTARKKVYPPGLCRSIAEIILETLESALDEALPDAPRDES
eukprot:6388209-Pyramimonas_sp.AAC.1